jgi:hypothetical protein
MSQKRFMAKQMPQGGDFAASKTQRDPHRLLNILPPVKRSQGKNHLGPSRGIMRILLDQPEIKLLSVMLKGLQEIFPNARG